MFKVSVVFGDNENGDDIRNIDSGSYEKQVTGQLNMIWEIKCNCTMTQRRRAY